MKHLEEIRKILELHKEIVRSKYGVKEIGIFGSYVRGEQGKKSDLDLLVEFERPVGLIEFVGLKNYFSDLFNIDVDLVMKRALRPRIGQRILKEAVYV